MKDIKSKNASIVIGILARDCAKSLRLNIPRLEELGSCFADYHVVVYENDSIDGTTEMLNDWASKNSHVVFIHEMTQQQTIPQETKDIPYPGQSVFRIEKMARFRNRVISETRKRFHPDLFCFIDIDIECFYPQSIAHAIDNAPKDWGGLFADGQIILDYGSHQVPMPIMYDYYAYTEKGINPFEEGDYAVRLTDQLAVVWVAQRFINRTAYHQCNSAFNGIGIYRWEAIEGLQYEVYQTPELKAVNASLCEHVPFNYCVVLRGYKNYLSKEIKTIIFTKTARKHSLLNRWKDYVPQYDFLKHNKHIKRKILYYIFRYIKNSFTNT